MRDRNRCFAFRTLQTPRAIFQHGAVFGAEDVPDPHLIAGKGPRSNETVRTFCTFSRANQPATNYNGTYSVCPNKPGGEYVSRFPGFRFFAFLIALTLSTLFVPAPDARADGDGAGLDLSFYGDFEALYIERDHTNNQDVGFFTPGNQRIEVLKTDDVIDDDEDFGGRAVLGIGIGPESSVEAVFTAFAHQGSKTKRDPGEDLDPIFDTTWPPGQVTVIGTSDFRSAATYDLEFSSNFWNAELNYRHLWEVDGADYNFHLLGGLRVVRLNEDISFISYDDQNNRTSFGYGNTGRYKVETRNTLIGAQIGAESHVPLFTDRLALDLYGVAGGFANQANVVVNYREDDHGELRNSRTEWDAAGVFEASAHLNVRVIDQVNLSFGYRAFYLMGLAVAPDQIAKSGRSSDFFGNTYDNDASTLFHGPSFKVSVRF